ncbi:MAG: tryptophan--tRNA ligase, partial [Actinobacteria bacterium]|nr:tryptophan--tRNA ligase [Actinomycetota bacterium]
MNRVFSGIQPTGEMHLGNYLGAVRRWVSEAPISPENRSEALYCVVDLHAMTVPYEPVEFAERTRRTAMLLLAAGLDPERCVLFVQSHVSAHTELTWILNCIATYGELRRMTQFKDKGQGQESVSVGLLDYPVLMAADILAYDTTEVPIGDDQRQHLELARDIAIRFNHRFGETLIVPKPTFPEVAARVKDLQNPSAKMSKSANSEAGQILLVDPPSRIAKKIKSAVTDSLAVINYDPINQPGVSNLLEILSAATDRTVEQTALELEG